MAHVFLAEPELDEDAAHAGVLRRFEARTVVAEVVDVGAVEHVVEPPFALLRDGDVVKLALAVKAAVAGVGHVAGSLDLVGLDELVARADLLGDRDGRLFLDRRQAGRHRRHSDGAPAEDLVCDSQDERAVDAPRVANERAAHVA